MGTVSAVDLTSGWSTLNTGMGRCLVGYALWRPEFEELLRNANTFTKKTQASVLEQGVARYSGHCTPEMKKEIRRFCFEALKERPVLAKHIHATYHDPAL
jgi:hypothetical protein